MHESTTQVLRTLLLGRSVAALATMHEGRASASMIPFAVHVADDVARLVTHVSGLAAHTRDMQVCPEVCLLVTAAESPGTMPQALPRVSLPAVAAFVAPEHPQHGPLQAAYLAKFPQTADLFALGDFSIVALTPTSARLVAGFARALTLPPAALAAALAPAHPPGATP